MVIEFTGSQNSLNLRMTLVLSQITGYIFTIYVHDTPIQDKPD